MAKGSNVVFVLDSSSSVGRRQFSHELKAIHTIMKRSREENKYAVVEFSSDAFVKLNFTDKWKAMKQVNKIRYIPGKTNIQKGLSLARELFLDAKSNITKGAQNKVLLITDGLSNVKQELTLYRGFQLKMMGAQIYVIATGRFMYGAPETVGLATTPFRHFFRLYNMKAFLKATRMIPEIPLMKGQQSPSRSKQVIH
ncbi:hypothetical protein QZH41_010346 [Actinostola sp. cb2023]|nr:hypothetical protein QZH41_010346 [Actinostola sp. cb2023]